MSGYVTKVYVVQKADGEVIAVKLTHSSAHAVAKRHAPARVHFAVADKTEELNVERQVSHPLRH